jgi:hypothetical protein
MPKSVYLNTLKTKLSLILSKTSKLFIYSFFSFFALSFSSTAQIKEINNIYKALDYVTNGDLLLIDIDDTIYSPVSSYASGQFFDFNYSTDKQNSLAIFNAFQTLTKVYACEANTVTIFDNLLDKSAAAILITHRAPDLRSATLRQLSDINFSLDKLLDNGVVSVWYQNERLCLFENGITWCSGTSKFTTFKELSQQINFPEFNRIVCIDDKYSNLSEFISNDNAFNFLGLHYKNYNKTKSLEDIINQFNRFLSSEFSNGMKLTRLLPSTK